MDEQLVEKLRQYMPNNSRLMARQMARLFDEYEQKDQPALNDWDKMDLDTLDKTLTYQENKKKLIELLRMGGYYSKKEMMLEEAAKRKDEDRLLKQSKREKREEEQLVAAEETRAKFEEALNDLICKKDEALDKLLCEKIPAIDKFHKFLELALNGSEYTKSLFIVGPAGTRKSFHVLSALKEKNLSFVLYNSHSTPLGLYEILYKNSHGIVVLDDIDAIVEDKRSVGILKAATFSASGERLVTWASTSKVLNDRGLPERFIFSGRVIILANDFHHNRKESFQAFLNRMFTYEIKMSEEERKLLVRTIFMKQDVFGIDDNAKQKMISYMESLLDFSNVSAYNLRTAFKAADIWKNAGEDTAKGLIQDLLDTDDKLRAFLKIEEIGKDLAVADRVIVWQKYTGYCSRDYYRVKSKYYQSCFGKKYAVKMEESDIIELINERRE